MRAVHRLCEFYPGICLTTEEKAWKNLSQGKKNLSQVEKNLSQSKEKPQSFLTSELDGSELLTPRPGHFTQEDNPVTH